MDGYLVISFTETGLRYVSVSCDLDNDGLTICVHYVEGTVHIIEGESLSRFQTTANNDGIFDYCALLLYINVPIMATSSRNKYYYYHTDSRFHLPN